MAPNSVDVTHAACQNRAPSAFLMCRSRQGPSPNSAMAHTPAAPLFLGIASTTAATTLTVPNAHQKLDASRERELKVTAKLAFLYATDQQKGGSPQRAELQDRRA